MKVSPSRSRGSRVFRAASRWSRGRMATSGSFSTSLYSRSGSGSWRRKATSILLCTRSSASVTENPLDTLISMLGSSSAQDAGRGREPGGFLSGQESDGENRLGAVAPRGAPPRIAASACANDEPGVVEKGAAGFGQFDASDAADEKSDADFLLEVADLAAERGLRRVKLLLRGELHAPRLGDRDEIAKMPKLHQTLSLPGIAMNIQSLFHRGQGALDLKGDRVLSRAQSRHISRDCRGLRNRNWIARLNGSGAAESGRHSKTLRPSLIS